ncbi:hypothetical protein [Thermostaphylospora chromogena]|uniref:Uncharacterized protein n=1 Tax=Thermostaphylospora chromogena TaxID=35622 RepID=A0A1H1DG62_9ACTN|nr:hypothetical protein [Thermostaphylospora chromogena]SDQ74826.1 hypothetical protein SAMN04489764_1966 [Thermostaphylospora chromogena]
MGMSRQTIFFLACAFALSAIIPGSAGYITGRLAVLERIAEDLRVREAILQARERAVPDRKAILDRDADRRAALERDTSTRTVAGHADACPHRARPHKGRKPNSRKIIPPAALAPARARE